MGCGTEYKISEQESRMDLFYQRCSNWSLFSRKSGMSIAFFYIHVCSLFLLCGSFHSARFSTSTRLDERINVIAVKPRVKSTISCAFYCLRDDHCTSFTFEEDQQKCTLLGAWPGSVYYDFNQRRAPVFNIQSKCPYSYFKEFNKCLVIPKTCQPASQSRRENARDVCQVKYQGHLVSLRSIEEGEAVARFLQNDKDLGSSNFWTDGYSFDGNFYFWESNEKPIARDLFGKGQPDTYGGGNQYCVDMLAADRHRLNDVSCDMPDRCSICQIDQ